MSSRATPFCKVCYDAGKPKELYLSHFVKDRPGPGGCVVCPTLLNQECRYCKEKGHTPTHCPKLAEKQPPRATEKQQPRATETWSYQTPRKTHTTQPRVAPGAPPRVRREEKTEEKVSASVVSSTNRFAALLAEVDSDDEDMMTTSEEVRKAIAKGPRAVEEPKKPVLVGWAAMAAKPAQVQVVERADVAQETPKRQVKYPDNPWKQMGLEAEKRLRAQPRSKWWGGEVRRWGDEDSDSDDDDASVGSSAW